MNRILHLILGALLLAACNPTEIFSGDLIDGRYYLAAAASDSGSGKMVCYRKSNGACDIRVPGPVTAIGYDDDFISAEIRNGSDPAEDDYYFIVRLFDSQYANGAQCLDVERGRIESAKKGKKKLECDVVFSKKTVKIRESNCAVRGPFDEEEFRALRKCHCVPVSYGSDEVKCIPGVGAIDVGKEVLTTQP
jgi:hypothetical protein